MEDGREGVGGGRGVTDANTQNIYMKIKQNSMTNYKAITTPKRKKK